MGTEPAGQDPLPRLDDRGNDFTSRSLLGLFSRVRGGGVVCRITWISRGVTGCRRALGVSAELWRWWPGSRTRRSCLSTPLRGSMSKEVWPGLGVEWGAEGAHGL